MNPFHRMRLYTVHIKPDEANASEKPQFISEGFNFYAFLLTFLWTLYHRLWWQTLAIFAFQFAMMMLGRNYMLHPISIGFLQLGFQAMLGFCGNDWLRAKLSRQGYIVADIAAGDSLLRAQQRYFERYLAAS